MSCEHLDALPVESVNGSLVAFLCPDCDGELDVSLGDRRRPCCGHFFRDAHLGCCPHYNRFPAAAYRE